MQAAVARHTFLLEFDTKAAIALIAGAQTQAPLNKNEHFNLADAIVSLQATTWAQMVSPASQPTSSSLRPCSTTRIDTRSTFFAARAFVKMSPRSSWTW